MFGNEPYSEMISWIPTLSPIMKSLFPALLLFAPGVSSAPLTAPSGVDAGVQEAVSVRKVQGALKDWKAAIAHVLPSSAETAWLDLPWQATLRAGLVKGAMEQKPVLLWAMNGHPLAST